MVHNMTLKRYFFDKIKCGEKIFEIRLNDDKRKFIKVGDEIFFKDSENQSDEIVVEVIDLLYFNSFAEMCKNIKLKDIGIYGSIQDAISIYHQFYSEEDEKKFGVVAIRIKVKSDI